MTPLRLRAVLVGAGNVGARFGDDPRTLLHYRYASHAQVLAAHPAFEWGAVVDRSPANLEAARARWDVPHGVMDPRELTDRYRPEVAVLATPPEGRAEIVGAFPGLKAVLVEKPLGPTAKEAEAFVEACRGQGVRVQVNLWRRGDAALRALAAGGLAKRIGRVQAATLVYGNGLRNNGSHMVDLVRMLLGEVVGVQALGTPAPAGPMAGDANVDFALRLSGGTTVAALALDFGAYRENALDVWGTSGRLTFDQEGLRIVQAPRRAHRAVTGADEVASDASEPLASGAGDALYHVYTNLAEALRGGAALWSPAEEALRTERVLDAVLQSAREGGRRLTV